MIEFDGSSLIFLSVGIATLAAATIPQLIRRAPISMPMVFLAAGFLAYLVVPSIPDPDPLRGNEVALRLTELCVIVSLMGAGLALNRPVGLKRWGTTWRLLAVTMPLSMIAVGLMGWWVLGLGVASAVLLAAALAPTDPVLATEVQVSEPADDPDTKDDEIRFALTSEAGLNDGLAFPFTYAAIAISLSGAAPSGWLGEWILVDVLWRLAVGVGIGLIVGWALGKLFFAARASRLRLAERAEGFVALAATFLAYGAAELAEGYGFIAVFVCAVAIRAAERQHGYHGVLHKFVEQVERLLTVAVIVLLGGAIARGLFDSIGWTEIVVAAVILLVVRPLAGWIGLTPGRTGPRERGAIAFFGVRGVGSLFYVAYAIQNGVFPESERIWAIVGLVVVGSIIVHGLSATPVMARVDGLRATRARKRGSKDGATIPV